MTDNLDCGTQTVAIFGDGVGQGVVGMQPTQWQIQFH